MSSVRRVFARRRGGCEQETREECARSEKEGGKKGEAAMKMESVCVCGNRGGEGEKERMKALSYLV